MTITCKNYALIAQETVPEIEGTVFLMKHLPSGARVLYLQNNAEECAFSIAFKTPPKDDTGVFHILEHSVLCGSDRYPVKEPFVDLAKASMNTYLNAMTFPDKTMYPVASINEKDLINMVDVYMDAVLHPAIYRKKTIFMQEGWHYELEGDNLSYNGVVYNEMKGALAEPSTMLFTAILGALFPDTAYRFESGGIPEAIHTLTYEQFLDAHRRHYRLDNAYVFVSGKIDIEAFLNHLDEEFLTPDANLNKDALCANEIGWQKPVINLGHDITYPADIAKACCMLAYAFPKEAWEKKTGKPFDEVADGALGLIMTLMHDNASPIKKALLDADLGTDISVSTERDLQQPAVFILLDGVKSEYVNASDKTHSIENRLRGVLEAKVRELVEQGIPRDFLESALSPIEFKKRENDTGAGASVNVAVKVMSKWLYLDENDHDYASEVFSTLKWEDKFARLHALIKDKDSRYFEDMLEALFLENNHMAGGECIPCDEDPTAKESLSLTEAFKNMTDDDKERIKIEADELRKAQETPDDPTDSALIPRMSIKDLGPGKTYPQASIDTSHDRPCIRCDINTLGISYVSRIFNLNN
ncbi:MAG: insulinase family protein, partial [Eggerthellaceae bacterium]|nr:insulinase family protein [Eggerthellaceae bacterium]